MKQLTRFFIGVYLVSSIVLAILVTYALCTGVLAHADFRVEPTISNYQGSVKGTSVVVVEWPDGKVDKLVYKDVEKDSNGFIKWFNERYDDYERRAR